MIQDIIFPHLIFCDLKEVTKKSEIGSSRKLPDIRNFNIQILCNNVFKLILNKSMNILSLNIYSLKVLAKLI